VLRGNLQIAGLKASLKNGWKPGIAMANLYDIRARIPAFTKGHGNREKPSVLSAVSYPNDFPAFPTTPETPETPEGQAARSPLQCQRFKRTSANRDVAAADQTLKKL
jgi:hypothetical protein